MDENKRQKNKTNKDKKSFKKDSLNTNKIIRIALFTIFMVATCVISYIGIYVIKSGDQKNIIRDYRYANDFNKYYEFVIAPNRSANEENVFLDKDGNVVRLVPDNEIQTEEATKKEKPDIEKIKKETGDENAQEYTIAKKAYRYNAADVLNKDKFIENKNKIKRSLADQKITSYNIREDLETGKLVYEIPQTEISDLNSVTKLLTQSGKFEVVDAQTDRPYLKNEDIKEAKLLETAEYGVILNVELKEKSKEKFKEITAKYAEKTNKIKEANEAEAKKKAEEGGEENNSPLKTSTYGRTEGAPELAIKLSGTLLQRGEVPKAIENGIIQIPLGKTDPKSQDYQRHLAEISTIYTGLKVGEKPVLYDLESQKFVEGNASFEKTQNVIYILGGIFLVMAISLVIFFKGKGILSALSLITYLAIMLITIRYTNIYITVSVIVGVTLLYIMQFILLVLLNLEYKKYGKIDLFKSYVKEYKELIVVLIAAIILCFAPYTEFAGFGKVVFLGIIISLIYNYFITKNLLKD